MRIVPLMPGIEMHFVALALSALIDQPVEQGAAETRALPYRMRDEIIDVENVAPGEKAGNAKAHAGGDAPPDWTQAIL